MEVQSGKWAERRADMLRRSAVDAELAELYKRRAGKEKHISRIIPEYSEEWDNDPTVKKLDKHGQEKRISAEMVMLTVEKEDLAAAHRAYEEAMSEYIAALSEEERAKENGTAARYEEILRQMDLMDRALLYGQKVIRQTGMIQRSVMQALKFRFGSSGLSEPLKIALRGVDAMEPVLHDFYTFIGKKCVDQELRHKIKYCQVGGSDWAWEAFDLDVMGLVTRMFHRVDMKRFNAVDVEILDVRYRVYQDMSQVASRRACLTEALLKLAEECGIGVEEAAADRQAE